MTEALGLVHPWRRLAGSVEERGGPDVSRAAAGR